MERVNKPIRRRSLLQMTGAGTVVSAMGTRLPTATAQNPSRSETAAAIDTGLADPLSNPSLFAAPPAGERPRTRWWWASPLSEQETRAEVAAIADAGFGGIEIAFNRDAWATPEQRANLAAALAVARERGLAVDMTMGAAWPISTPNTGEGTGLSQTEVIYGRVDVRGGTTFDGTVPGPFDDPEFERGGELVGVSAARVLERHEPAELLPEEERPTWGSPIAGPAKSTVLDPASLTDLTGEVDGRRLRWRAPHGDWIVFAYWARDAEESVMNHFYAESARAVGEYLEEYQIGPDNLGSLREVGAALFEDSLEHSAVSLYWSPEMAQQFEQRRGYAAMKYLALMFQHGMTNYWVPGPDEEPAPDFDLPDGEGVKIRTDYYRTLTDLYVDEHMQVFQNWAEKLGVDFKNQVAYGLPLEPIRSARELAKSGGRVESESFNSGDRIPWTEDGNPMWRYAMDHQRHLVGGTHQGGQTRISTELGAQYHTSFEFNLGDYKGMMDKEWAAGITLPFLHGFSYQTGDDPWPGTLRFGDVLESWNENYPQFAHWKPLTDYWARGTYVLEAGTPRTDLAIYRDGFLTTTARGEDPVRDEYGAPRQLFDAAPLERAGYTVQYIDPLALSEDAANGRETLFPDTSSYQAVVIDERTMPARAAQALHNAARKGFRVVIVGAPPAKDTTFASGSAGDRQVQKTMQRLLKLRTVAHVDSQAEVASALQDLQLQPRVSFGSRVKVYSQFRRTKQADYYFLYNAGAHEVGFTPSFASTGVPHEMNLWTGEIRPLAQYDSAGRRTIIPVRLAGLETRVIAFDRDGRHGQHVTSTDEPFDITVADHGLTLRSTESGTFDLRLDRGSRVSAVVNVPDVPAAGIGPRAWHLSVAEVGPDGETQHELDVPGGLLMDWRSLPELNDVAGVGTYVGTFDVPDELLADSTGAYLRLGTVHGSVKVHLNGELVAPDVVAGRDWDATALLQPGENEIRIELASTLRNSVTAHNGTSTRKQAQGVLGPVVLEPFGTAVLAD